jgi:AbrB family looped-hinge helix DNA binding protein
MAVSVKMSRKHQIVVPKIARDALGLSPGDRLTVIVRDGVIEMEKQPPDLEDRLAGALGDVTADATLWAELEGA